jgi:hypothetical protein
MPRGRATLVMDLQRMHHLGNLRMFVFVTPVFHGKDYSMTTSPAELSCFRFIGRCAQAESSVAGLVTPCENSRIPVTESHSFHFSCVSMFIRGAEIFFFAARLVIFGTHLTTSMFSCPHSIDDQINNVFSIKPPFDTWHPRG